MLRIQEDMCTLLAGNEMKSRDNYVDFVRGVGILLVVFGHTCVCWQRPVFGFHMPLFFFLSGLFLSKYLALPFRESCCKVLKKTLSPFVTFFFIGLVSYLAHVRLSIPWLRFADGIWTGHPIVNPPLWFLTSLFFSTMLAVVILRKFPVCGGYALLLGAAILLNLVPHRIRHHFPLMMCSWPYAAAFIMAGYQSLPLLVRVRQMDRVFLCGSCGVLLVLFEIVLALRWPMSSMSYDCYFIGPFLITSILGVVGILLPSLMLVKVLPTRICKGVCFVGENSLYFFCLDLVVLSWVQRMPLPQIDILRPILLFLCQTCVLSGAVVLILYMRQRNRKENSYENRST